MSQDQKRWQYPCPMCGAIEGAPCEPLRSGRFATTLHVHKERGAMPWTLERNGYRQVSPGRWRRPATNQQVSEEH